MLPSAASSSCPVCLPDRMSRRFWGLLQLPSRGKVSTADSQPNLQTCKTDEGGGKRIVASVA